MYLFRQLAVASGDGSPIVASARGSDGFADLFGTTGPSNGVMLRTGVGMSAD